MDRKTISAESLEKWMGLLLSSNTVFAPKKKGNRTEFEPIQAFSEMTFDYIATNQSPKQALFPRNETIMTYAVAKDNVEVQEYKLDNTKKTIIFGARPCDAIGLEALEAIFKWDYKDSMFLSRKENTTLIGMACVKCDEYCFCTSVNGGPGNTDGLDLLLTPMENNVYLVEMVTDKGKVLVDQFSELFGTDNGADKEKYLTKVPVISNFHNLEKVLPQKFNEKKIWLDQSLRCIGCGACAYVCPACACFDIQDESRGKIGKRVKCWDSCGFRVFTLHTSGHNPREVQSERWRQRIMHKFSYMPQRQNVFGCIGCGRCSRACPVDMNISEHLQQLAQ
jgi:sulfhydrogenase subunit beta (sulfur reductase)